MSKELTPDFSYSFKAPVWKTCPDPENPILALEIRDNDTHRVSFSIVRLDKQQVILDNHVFDESWWISLVAISDPAFFTRIFPDEQDPDKSILQAFDFRQNTLLWAIPGLVSETIGHRELTGYIQDGDDRKACIIEISTGKITFTDRKAEKGESKLGALSHAKNLYYPVQYHEGDDGFKTLKKFVSRLAEEPVMAIDYLEFGDYIIINYYNRSDSELVNFLLIIDRKGEILYHERTGIGKGIAKDTYFIMEKVLVFIENRKDISALILT